MRDVVVRLAVVCLCLGLAAGLAVHYGATATENDPYVTGAELTSQHATHTGEHAFVWGRVVDVGDAALVIAVDGERVVVRRTTAAASVGDAVQVFGTVESDGSIAATRVVVSPRDDLVRMYLVSALGALLALGAVLRYWRLDPRRLRVVARER